jgi:hypothetical protein
MCGDWTSGTNRENAGALDLNDRELQDSVDAGHQPWLPSAESVAIAYAQGELHLFAPYAEPIGLGAYQVRSHHGEWEATLYLAQPVRHDNGVWVVTRVGEPVS